MARLIRATGVEEVRKPADTQRHKWTLKELQEAVGGYIEVMPGVTFRMVMNEEGALRHLPVNLVATMLVREDLLRHQRTLRYIPTIVGDVLILEKGERM